MKEFFPVLHTAALFSGISDEELAAMLSCLGARIGTFPKGSRLLRAGEAVEEVGLVLAGSALMAGGGAGAAAVAFILIDFNDPSFHVRSSCCFCALIVLY